MGEINCLNCKENFEVQVYRKNIAKFCSNKCKGEYQSESRKGRNHPMWNEKSHIKLNCLQCEKEYDEKIHRKKRSKFCSNECKYQWQSENLVGNIRYNWTGESSLNNLLRHQSKWKIWRELVFLRDNFTCQNPNCEFCENKIGVLLHPHHIKPVALFPELVFIVDNGITYCAEFHLKSGLHKNMQKEKNYG